MAAQPSATRRPTYSSSSSSSSLHPHPIISQPPVSSRVTRPSTSGSSAWVPTFSVSDSQMLNEHTVMSAEGFVAIPKSPTTEAMVNSSTTTVMGGGGGKEKKEKGKKRAKVFALGKLMVKEVLGGGGNNNNITLTAAVQKEVVVSPKEKKAVHSYGRGGAARPKYKATNLLQPPTPSSAQSVEDSLSAQALRKTLTPLSAPHLPTHRSHSPNYDTLRAGRYPYPPAPATIGPSSTTRHDGYRAVHSPPPPSPIGSASVVSAPHYYGEYHRPSPPHHQYQRPQYQPQEQPQPQQQPQPQHHHMRRKSSLSLQSATTLTTTSSSGSFTAKTPSTAQTSNWVGSPQLVSSSAQQPYYGGAEAAASSYVVENTSRRRSMSASDIARLAEQDQQQQLYYGKTLPIMQQLAPPSAEQLDSFVPSVHRQASMQELQRTSKPARPRPAALHLGRTSPAPLPTLHVVPDVIIDQGSPSEESSFASPAPPVGPRETVPAATKRSSKPLPKGYARGSVAGAGEDDTEWVLSESMTVVGFPTTQSSDSFQFDTKEGVKRSVSSVGSTPPAAGGKRESRGRGGVEVVVVKEEWRSERDVGVVEEDGGDGEDEGYTSPDATPRGQRVAPAPAPAAVQPSPSPYVPSQQPISRELPIPVVPPPYGAPLPQLQQQHLHYQHAPLPQMAGLPMHNMNVVPQISPLQLAALLPQMGAGMLAPQAAAPPNLLASLLAAQAPSIQQQQQQQQQQLQQALELYLALANMNLALSAEQMRNAGSDSQ